MIQPLRDLYLVSLNEEENTKTASGIVIDTSWNPMLHAVRRGIVESLPLSISKEYKDDVDVKIGDRIYFHHFIHADDNYILDGDKKLFKCNRYHAYCIVQNEKIVVLDQWILASPILETEESIIKTFGTLKLWTKASPDKVLLHAKAEHISKECKKQGIKVGDEIIFRKDSDYDITIEGKEYWRMKLPNVVAVIRKGKVIPLRNEILIWNEIKTEEVRPSGLIIAVKPQKEQRTKILAIGVQDEEKEFEVGQEIMYLRHFGQKIEHDGIKYIVLKQEEVVGAFQEVQ